MKPRVSGPLESSILWLVAPKHATPACCSTHLPRPQTTSRRRRLHTSRSKEQHAIFNVAATPSPPPAASAPDVPVKSGTATMPALSCLPLSQILRTYLITSISSSPRSLGASTTLLRRMLESNNALFDLRNPVMRSALWHTFYRQFCAGETEAQVAKSCEDLRQNGYAGVILEYALEVLKDAEGNEAKDVAVWRKGMLDTVSMAAPGDFVGLKWSGMGPAAMRRMKADVEPTEKMSEAMHALCQAAAKKGISLLPAAEETWSLNGFHNWCMKMQRVYNLGGKSVVYSTYQAYLKQTPATISRHLTQAKEEGFTLGLKLVRGAYLGSEDRNLIWPSIEATHEAYDGVAKALIHRRYNDWIQPLVSSAMGTWPGINVMLATHNAASVQKAQALRRQQAADGEELTPLSFAQLQGMADEVSCSLIAAARAAAGDEKAVKERVFKCTTWGSMFECLNYLLRRAAENKDAASRTSETRRAMQAELWRRLRTGFGMA